MSMIEHITIKNLKIIGALSVDHVGIYIKNANDVIVDHVGIDDCYNAAIMLDNVVDAFVTRNIIKRSNMGGLGYGLAVLNSSRNITGTSNHFYECRHGICSGGDHLYGVQYAQTYIGNTMSHSKLGVGMFGPHPTCDGYTVIGNTCIGCTLGGFNGINNIISGNVVDNPSYESPGIFIPECAQNSVVSDNIIRVKNLSGILVRTKYPNLSITNNQIKCDGTDTQGISIANDIDGLSIRGNTIECIATAISISDYAGTKNTSDCIITDNKLTSTLEYGIRINCPTYSRSNIKISGNIITAPEPILIGGATAKMSINNNTLFATGECIRLYSTASSHERIDIINNICHGGTDLIDFQQCNYIQVLGNVLYDATGYAVSCNADNTHYSIIGNVITNCTSSIRNISPATDQIITNNPGFNPVGNFTAPTVPASTVAYTNSYGYPCMVSIYGGTVTAITIDGVATGQTSGTFVLSPGETIAITYSSAPTWKWFGL